MTDGRTRIEALENGVKLTWNFDWDDLLPWIESTGTTWLIHKEQP